MFNQQRRLPNYRTSSICVYYFRTLPHFRCDRDLTGSPHSTVHNTIRISGVSVWVSTTAQPLISWVAYARRLALLVPPRSPADYRRHIGRGILKRPTAVACWVSITDKQRAKSIIIIHTLHTHSALGFVTDIIIMLGIMVIGRHARSTGLVHASLDDAQA